MKRQEGFSIIQILIAVIIIGIIAVIAVPYLLRSRKSSVERTTIATMRTIQFAQGTYYTTMGAQGYGTFNDLNGEKLLDSSYSGASVNRNNYTIALSVTPANTTPVGYCIKATPQNTGSGAKYFGTSQKNIVYESTASGDIACANGILTTSGGAVAVTNY